MSFKKIFLSLLISFFFFISYCFSDEKESSVYIFAHQDDELLISSKMKKEVDSGINVYCIWTTKGEKAAPAEIREKESRDAMKLTGVPDSNLYFLGYSDQESYKDIPEIIEKVLEIIKKIKPNRIYANAYEGGNIDHDVVNFVAFESARRSGLKIELYDFPLYNNYYGYFKVNEFIPIEGTEILYTKLSDDDLDFKEELFNIYKSQKLGNLAMRTFLFDVSKMIKFGEPYRKMPEYNYLEKPHKGKLLYEVTIDKKASHSFADFKSAVEKYYSKINFLLYSQ